MSSIHSFLLPGTLPNPLYVSFVVFYNKPAHGSNDSSSKFPAVEIDVHLPAQEVAADITVAELGSVYNSYELFIVRDIELEDDLA